MGAKFDSPNQVWSIDITYIHLARGFAYLVAITDWYSRKVNMLPAGDFLHRLRKVVFDVNGRAHDVPHDAIASKHHDMIVQDCNVLQCGGKVQRLVQIGAGGESVASFPVSPRAGLRWVRWRRWRFAFTYLKRRNVV